MSTWAQLRELREGGRRPARPLCVTTMFARCMKQAEEGAMVVVHVPGEKFDAELLHGLDVELYLDGCAQASAVRRLVCERNVEPKSFRVWCRCEESLQLMWPRDCAACADMREAWEALCRRAP